MRRKLSTINMGPTEEDVFLRNLFYAPPNSPTILCTDFKEIYQNELGELKFWVWNERVSVEGRNHSKKFIHASQ